MGVVALVILSGRLMVSAENAGVGDVGMFECDGCNLLLLNVELLRADHVGLLSGAGESLTPRIDRFFDQSIVFLDATAPSGSTYYSATATATGTEAMFNTHDLSKLNRRSGGGSWKLAILVSEEGELLVDRIPTIAQTLRAAGYATIGINDWIHSGPRVYLDRGYDHYIETPTFGSLFASQVDTLLEALDTHGKEPFFLYFHTNALHFEFHFPADYQPGDATLFERMRAYTRSEESHRVLRGRAPGVSTDDAWASYREQLAYVDGQMQRVFDYLRNESLENTIVVLYAHHGVGMGADGSLGVGLPYQDFIRVPLLVRHPRVQERIGVESTASLVDLAATLYDLTGVESLYPMESRSLTPLLAGEDHPRQYFFSRDLQYESVRRGPWKLVLRGGVPEALYHLEQDPEEQHNRYDPQLDIVAELRDALSSEKIRQVEYAARIGEKLAN